VQRLAAGQDWPTDPRLLSVRKSIGREAFSLAPGASADKLNPNATVALGSDFGWQTTF
jgi:hypothetical protein